MESEWRYSISWDNLVRRSPSSYKEGEAGNVYKKYRSFEQINVVCHWHHVNCYVSYHCVSSFFAILYRGFSVLVRRVGALLNGVACFYWSSNSSPKRRAHWC